MTQALLYIILAIVCAVGAKLLHRFVMIKTYPYAYSLILSIISAIIFLPLFILNFSIPKTVMEWIILISASILWPMVSVSAFRAYKGTEVSIKDPLTQSKILLVLILSMIFLKETVTVNRILGTLIIFLGICLLLWHPERKFSRLSDPGIRWTFLAAFLVSIVTVVDKYALNFFKPGFYVFVVYFFPSIILFLFLGKRVNQVKHLIKHRFLAVLFATILSAAVYFLALFTFKEPL
ncbi:MAG: EamA family transporter, partial [Nanoarchaeota archaeon]